MYFDFVVLENKTFKLKNNEFECAKVTKDN